MYLSGAVLWLADVECLLLCDWLTGALGLFCPQPPHLTSSPSVVILCCSVIGWFYAGLWLADRCSGANLPPAPRPNEQSERGVGGSAWSQFTSVSTISRTFRQTYIDPWLWYRSVALVVCLSVRLSHTFSSATVTDNGFLQLTTFSLSCSSFPQFLPLQTIVVALSSPEAISITQLRLSKHWRKSNTKEHEWDNVSLSSECQKFFFALSEILVSVTWFAI